MAKKYGTSSSSIEKARLTKKAIEEKVIEQEKPALLEVGLPVPQKRGAPMKECPSCGDKCHAKTGTCKNCGHVFEKKAKTEKPESSSKSTQAASSSLREVAALASRVGGLDELREVLEAVEAHGGVGQLLSSVELIQEVKNLDI